jgi:hypothetical protein
LGHQNHPVVDSQTDAPFPLPEDATSKEIAIEASQHRRVRTIQEIAATRNGESPSAIGSSFTQFDVEGAPPLSAPGDPWGDGRFYRLSLWGRASSLPRQPGLGFVGNGR